MTPNLGQGACQALIDAVDLADKVAGHQDLESGLRAYERSRATVTARLVRRSRAIGAVGQLRAAPLVAQRNTALKLAASP